MGCSPSNRSSNIIEAKEKELHQKELLYHQHKIRISGLIFSANQHVTFHNRRREGKVRFSYRENYGKMTSYQGCQIAVL